jgi:RNA polymerase sigma-70 factor (ECF subfamily)
VGVSSTNRDARRPPEAKELNPDLPPVPAGHTKDAAPSAPARPSPSDEELLHAYRYGDRAAFAELVNRYQRELFHFLVRFLGDRAAAEDVFQ